MNQSVNQSKGREKEMKIENRAINDHIIFYVTWRRIYATKMPIESRVYQYRYLWCFLLFFLPVVTAAYELRSDKLVHVDLRLKSVAVVEFAVERVVAAVAPRWGLATAHCVFAG